MTRRIQILPDVVANQIAAGEAVERPASAVKELVENALDADATRVEIAIERGGKRRVRVSDDGLGMGREDALLCFDRHATSKISVASDLNGVGTFGFRGEALPSIAAVSRLTLETWDGDGDVGTRVTLSGGQINDVSDHARRRGTTIEVRNLFFNAPVRARFLKSVSAETRAISEVVTALALANPAVAFTLTSDERPLLELASASDVAARVTQLWGAEHGGTLVGASGSENGFEVRGLVQRPDAAKPGVRRSYLFVNGRPFRATAVVRAVERGYRTTIPHGAKPWLFLYLQLPGDQVDVNVHPTKSEVRFREGSAVEGLVERVVRDALDREASSATFDTLLGTPPMAVHEPGPQHSGVEDVTDEPETQMALFMSGASDDEVAPVTSTPPVLDLGAQRPRLWQVLDTYVLAETRDGILIVDQHSAHERILFQRLIDGFEMGGQESQRLLFPMTLRLTPPERIAMTFACKGAIKAGQKLSEAEMQELFDQLFATELPHHDVHGRPTVVRLSASELARKFGRS